LPSVAGPDPVLCRADAIASIPFCRTSLSS
jgi:hypothetical protein